VRSHPGWSTAAIPERGFPLGGLSSSMANPGATESSSAPGELRPEGPTRIGPTCPHPPMDPENPVVISRGNLQRMEELKRVLKRVHIDAWITRPHGGKINS
jgi:hypothetical protein